MHFGRFLRWRQFALAVLLWIIYDDLVSQLFVMVDDLDGRQFTVDLPGIKPEDAVASDGLIIEHQKVLALLPNHIAGSPVLD